MNDIKYLDDLSFGVQVISPEFEYLYLNKKLLAEVHLNQEQIIGKSMSMVFPGIETTSLYKAIEETFHTRIPRHVINEFTISDNYTAFYRLKIENYGSNIIIFSEDITTEKNTGILLEKTNMRLENEVKKRTAELEGLNSLLIVEKERAQSSERATASFLANMSHEIRTPISGIIGLVDLLLESELNIEQKEFLQSAFSCAEHLLHIINEVLELSKIQSVGILLNPTHLDFESLVKDIGKTLSVRAASKNIALSFKYDSDLPKYIKVDGVRLRQIFFNLVGNAIKFTDSGSVKITAQKKHEDILVTIEDTGIGIKDEMHDFIFSPFRQIDETLTRRESSTGLGLSISKMIIEIMGGKIWFESTLGQGSKFFFSFPCLVSEAFPEQVKIENSVPLTKNRVLKVLLAEDNELNAKVASTILSRLGCDVVVAKDGNQAITYFESDNFDLCFFDLHMPIMDGFTAAKTIRNREDKTKRVPIYALTADVTSEQIEILHYMDGILTKPARKSEFRTIIDKIGNLTNKVA